MTLSQQLLAEETRPAVVAALVQVVRQEVADKRGISAVALKAGYAGATTVVPNLVERVLERLLPEFARALDPLWDGFLAADDTEFGSYLAAHGRAASSALLGVTDTRVAASSNEPVKKAYRAVRGKADGHVEAALPRLGATLQRHAPAG
ncbi:DUF6918 family protein [Nocardioides pelophilus]|uniref:DUF6918 family protein n=1 Tax=Nocardioides pelophilus TaxID=2172019 RepID=UPI001C815A1E|nr:hypothetical protein [Nocardioides pelophilus]